MSNDARIWQWTDTQRSTLTRLWNEDSTLHDIAEAIGCSWRQASDERARLGLEQRPPGWQPRNRERYWTTRPEAPGCRNADAAFASAMAGRKFGSLKVSADPQRLYSRSLDVGMGSSSMNMNG